MRKKLIFRFALIACSLYMIWVLTACDIYTKADVDNAINNATFDLNDKITNLNTNISDKESMITSLEGEIATLTLEKESLEENIETLNIEKTSFMATVSELELKISELEEEVSLLLTSGNDNGEKIDKLESDIATLEAEKASLNAEISEINASISVKNEEIKSLNAALSALNDEKTTLLGRIDELEKENAALKNCIEGIHTGDESVCTVCGSSKQPVPDNKAQSKFEKKQYTDNGATINYWLYTPENATENMPLIVYLHGGSGKGDNLELIISVDGFPQYLHDGKITPNAYVIIPQVSSSYRGWGEIKAEIMKLIAFVKNECKIDENRISLTGHSMGGTGVWMFALAYPSMFSAIAPLSGSVTLTDANVEKLKNVPVWAIIGTEDTIVDPQSSIDFIAELSKVNDNAMLTELNDANHFDVPSMSYLSTEFDLIAWLIQQSK